MPPKHTDAEMQSLLPGRRSARRIPGHDQQD
jgi:hypothetical protein